MMQRDFFIQEYRYQGSQDNFFKNCALRKQKDEKQRQQQQQQKKK